MCLPERFGFRKDALRPDGDQGGSFARDFVEEMARAGALGQDRDQP